jgi:hypothetical protein
LFGGFEFVSPAASAQLRSADDRGFFVLENYVNAWPHGLSTEGSVPALIECTNAIAAQRSAPA